MSAAIIGTNLSYIILTFLPPLVWLIFYLREDCHPEPKFLIITAFIAGVASAAVAVFVELLLIGPGGLFAGSISLIHTPLFFFLVIALVEEYAKYLAVRFSILQRHDFDEPIDGMIYMITAALGFAAIENTLFILPLFHESILAGFEITANRFLGANLLHALSSGLVGFFLARAWFSPRRHHFVLAGILIATLLHASFNYLILIKDEVPQGVMYVIFLLLLMAVMVLVDFERLKEKQQVFANDS